MCEVYHMISQVYQVYTPCIERLHESDLITILLHLHIMNLLNLRSPFVYFVHSIAFSVSVCKYSEKSFIERHTYLLRKRNL